MRFFAVLLSALVLSGAPLHAEETDSGFGAYFAYVQPPGFTDPEMSPAIAAAGEMDADAVAGIEPAAGDEILPEDAAETEADAAEQPSETADQE